MIVAIDVAYHKNMACAAGIIFQSWNSGSSDQEVTIDIKNIASYIPGQFYLRELPCVVRLLEKIKIPINCIIIDGYVELGIEKSPGFGMMLWRYIEGSVPVIGVAKTKYSDTPLSAEVYRGSSTRPLFVTAVGMDHEIAKGNVVNMAGKFRIPELIKAADRLCRERVGS